MFLELMLKAFKILRKDLDMKRAGLQPEWPFNIHHMLCLYFYSS